MLLVGGFIGKIARVNHHRPNKADDEDEQIAKNPQNCQKNEEGSDVEARREFAGVFVGMRGMLGVLGVSNDSRGLRILHDFLNPAFFLLP